MDMKSIRRHAGTWFDLIGYQVVWFTVVIGAGHGHPGGGLALGALFVVSQLAFSRHIARECMLLGMALLIGTAVDGVPSMLGWWHYASPSPALPPGGAPTWILVLWLSFATTLSRSMAFVHGRPFVAALLGAIGAPMAYLAAAHGWQAVILPASPVLPVLWLGVTWGLALPLLSHMAMPSSALHQE